MSDSAVGCYGGSGSLEMGIGLLSRGSQVRALAGASIWPEIVESLHGSGRVDWRRQQWAPGNGAVLATAGDLVFWGDLNRRFKAFDAETGKVLWETIVGGIVSVSTITYAVNGKQYVAVMTGEGQTGTTRA